MTAGMAEEVAKLLGMSGNDGHEETFRTENLPSINQVFSPRNLDASWDDFKRRIFDRDLTALKYCSNSLLKYFEENVIPQSDLDKILEEVETLYKEVVASDLHNDLKRVVLQNLHNIKTAINDYNVRGVEGLEESLAIILGTAQIAGDETTKTPTANKAEKSDTEKKNEDLVEKYAKLAELLTKVIALGKAGKPLMLKAFHIIHPLLPG